MRCSTIFFTLLPALALAQTSFDASALLSSAESALGTNTAYYGILSSAYSVLATNTAAQSQYSSLESQYASDLNALTGGGTVTLPGATGATATATESGGAAQATASGSGAQKNVDRIFVLGSWVVTAGALGAMIAL